LAALIGIKANRVEVEAKAGWDGTKIIIVVNINPDHEIN